MHDKRNSVRLRMHVRGTHIFGNDFKCEVWSYPLHSLAHVSVCFFLFLTRAGCRQHFDVPYLRYGTSTVYVVGVLRYIHLQHASEAIPDCLFRRSWPPLDLNLRVSRTRFECAAPGTWQSILQTARPVVARPERSVPADGASASQSVQLELPASVASGSGGPALWQEAAWFASFSFAGEAGPSGTQGASTAAGEPPRENPEGAEDGPDATAAAGTSSGAVAAPVAAPEHPHSPEGCPRNVEGLAGTLVQLTLEALLCVWETVAAICKLLDRLLQEYPQLFADVLRRMYRCGNTVYPVSRSVGGRSKLRPPTTVFLDVRVV